jgi:hypothetical protein
MNIFLVRGSLLFCFLAIVSSLQAQYHETIRTGRPGEAIGPFAVGSRVFQVQAGIGYLDYSQYTSSTEGDSHAEINGDAFLLGSVFRMGITEHFEVNAGIVYSNGSVTIGDQSTLTQTSNNSGIQVLNLGLRSNIYVGSGWLPSVGFQVNLGMPWLSTDYYANYIHPRLILITNQRMAEKWALTTNWGIFWNGNNAEPLGFYVINVSFDASSKWSVFIEPYGFYKNAFFEPHIDGGAGYLVNNNLQLDIAGGLGLGPDDYQDWFVNAGVSWRVRFKEKAK